ncbi:hypothetical protein DFH06DRAFT_535621 [Mycena polygramma]|nr:hypothetical protein DFH06DRAFT_535621 [Mycena polygramma]
MGPRDPRLLIIPASSSQRFVILRAAFQLLELAVPCIHFTRQRIQPSMLASSKYIVPEFRPAPEIPRSFHAYSSAAVATICNASSVGINEDRPGFFPRMVCPRTFAVPPYRLPGRFFFSSTGIVAVNFRPIFTQLPGICRRSPLCSCITYRRAHHNTRRIGTTELGAGSSPLSRGSLKIRCVFFVPAARYRPDITTRGGSHIQS